MLTTDIIGCSSPVTAVIATDNLSDYPTLLRQISRDGMITSVEFERMDGALVSEVDSETEFYDFDEEDLTDIKDGFGIK